MARTGRLVAQACLLSFLLIFQLAAARQLRQSSQPGSDDDEDDEKNGPSTGEKQDSMQLAAIFGVIILACACIVGVFIVRQVKVNLKLLEKDKLSFLDKDGDKMMYEIEPIGEKKQLIQYVGGKRMCGENDTSGVLKKLTWENNGEDGHKVVDQYGWGGFVPEEHLWKLKDLAARAGVENNLPDFPAPPGAEGPSAQMVGSNTE